MLEIAFTCAAILSKGGCSDAAANTVSEVGEMPAPQLIRAQPPEVVPPHGPKGKSAIRTASRLITGQLYMHVGCFHDSDRRHSRLEVELVDRLPGEKRNKTVRPGLDLDLSRDAVFDDARDDPGEAIARGLLDRRLTPVLALGLGDRRQ